MDALSQFWKAEKEKKGRGDEAIASYVWTRTLVGDWQFTSHGTTSPEQWLAFDPTGAGAAHLGMVSRTKDVATPFIENCCGDFYCDPRDCRQRGAVCVTQVSPEGIDTFSTYCWPCFEQLFDVPQPIHYVQTTYFIGSEELLVFSRPGVLIDKIFIAKKQMIKRAIQ